MISVRSLGCMSVRSLGESGQILRTTKWCWEVARDTENYQAMLRCSEIYRELQRDTERYTEKLKTTNAYWGIQRNAENCQRWIRQTYFEKDSTLATRIIKGYREILRITKRCWDVARDTEHYREIPWDTERYHELRRHAKRYRDMPRTAKIYRWTLRDIKIYNIFKNLWCQSWFHGVCTYDVLMVWAIFVEHETYRAWCMYGANLIMVTFVEYEASLQLSKHCHAGQLHDACMEQVFLF